MAKRLRPLLLHGDLEARLGAFFAVIRDVAGLVDLARLVDVVWSEDGILGEGFDMFLLTLLICLHQVK